MNLITLKVKVCYYHKEIYPPLQEQRGAKEKVVWYSSLELVTFA